MPSNSIPVLQAEQRMQQVPERVRAALDARAAEKALLRELVEQWLQVLRPEMERQARDIVERSAQTYWRQHPSETGPEPRS